MYTWTMSIYQEANLQSSILYYIKGKTAAEIKQRLYYYTIQDKILSHWSLVFKFVNAQTYASRHLLGKSDAFVAMTAEQQLLSYN